MLKQSLAFMMMISLVFGTTSASAATGLNEIFDSFNYTLQVEGNADLAKANLQKDLAASGASASEIMNAALSQVKDASAKQEIAQTLSLVNAGNLSQDAAESMVQDILSRSSSKGAAWDGGSGVAVVGLVILVAAAAYFLLKEDCNDRNLFEDERGVCQDI